jgi:hypothetical protein
MRIVSLFNLDLFALQPELFLALLLAKMFSRNVAFLVREIASWKKRPIEKLVIALVFDQIFYFPSRRSSTPILDLHRPRATARHSGNTKYQHVTRGKANMNMTREESARTTEDEFRRF